jgi:fructose-1,6-bisphosphatase/inositol monophosphatase family enzyme
LPVNSSNGPAADKGLGGGNTVRTVDVRWRERLLMLHRQVRSTVAKTDRGGTGSKNAKGDDVKRFDLAANDTALAVLRSLQLPVVVDSEESEPLELGFGPLRHRIVLDPVDGSDNWARGLPFSALSCAVLPIDAPLHPNWVEAAVVGPLDQDTPLIALKGAGVWRGTARLRTSGVRSVANAMISVELNHHSPSPGLARLMATARGVRCYGCASRAISLIAEGATDAHVDSRGHLTAESYLAAARLVIEAGGWIAGIDGTPLTAPESLTDRVSLVAASSRELCDKIVEILSHG